MTGQLCLKWNNHTTAFNKLLGKIYLEDMYSDGTILCQGKFYPVHRFVLSTCSEYFEEMFRQCVRLNNKHPFIIVKDIHPEQMEALLNYMYKGEVNVPQEMLPELIKAAEAFKIKGLAVPDEEPSKPSRKRSSACSPPSIPKRSRKQEDKSSFNKSDNLGSDNKDNDNLSDSPSTSTSKSEEIFITEPQPKVKSEPIDHEETPEIAQEDTNRPIKDEQNFENYGGEDSFEPFSYDPGEDNFDEDQPGSWDNSQGFEGEAGNEDDPSQRIVEPLILMTTLPLSNEELIRVKEGWKCPLCDYTRYQKSHVKRHFLSHASEKLFKCPYCTFECPNKSFALWQTHMLSCFNTENPT